MSAQRPQRPPDLNLPVLMLKNIMKVAFPLNPVMLDYFATTKSKIRLLTTKITSVEELQKKYKLSLHFPPHYHLEERGDILKMARHIHKAFCQSLTTQLTLTSMNVE